MSPLLLKPMGRRVFSLASGSCFWFWSAMSWIILNALLNLLNVEVRYEQRNLILSNKFIEKEMKREKLGPGAEQ